MGSMSLFYSFDAEKYATETVIVVTQLLAPPVFNKYSIVLRLLTIKRAITLLYAGPYLNFKAKEIFLFFLD
jgi:hypothetical protein